MMETTKINLEGVQETLLMPLWGRAFESEKKKPLLIDDEALRLVNAIDYDFTKIKQKVNPLSRASWVSRSIYFDERIKDYLANNPNGTIINVGCGLDTTYERLNNGKAIWYELDFPQVIEARSKLLKQADNRKFLPFSVFDSKWYSLIKDKDSVFIMIAGVIYYFEEDDVRKLFDAFSKEFGNAVIVFDYSSRRGIQIANKKVIEDGGMDKTAYLKWGIDDIKGIESWRKNIKVIHNMKMFTEHRKKYPFKKRIGMWISDALSIMSLATITIERSV